MSGRASLSRNRAEDVSKETEALPRTSHMKKIIPDAVLTSYRESKRLAGVMEKSVGIMKNRVINFRVEYRKTELQ